MEVPVYDPNRVSSPKDDSPNLGINGKIKADEDSVGLTELKRHRIKLRHVSQMGKDKELLCQPTENGN